MKKYNIIYADPPYFYNKRSNKTRFGGGASRYYPLMKTQDICDLNIQKICADNCVLFLWSCFPNLEDSLKIGKAWGFTYKTLGFSWIKLNKKNKKPFFGVGYYTKSNCEVCLLFIKGKIIKPVSNKVSSCIISERQEHSKKPDETRKRIEELYGNLPRIELFAREKVEGWDCWGNEVEGIKDL